MYDINKSHETLNICFKECIFTINSCKELLSMYDIKWISVHKCEKLSSKIFFQTTVKRQNQFHWS